MECLLSNPTRPSSGGRIELTKSQFTQLNFRSKRCLSPLLILRVIFGSPRRRSKTPDSSEKLKRNVHFQDEEKNDQSDPRESVSLNERTTRQDPREIMHPDGKVYSKRARL